MIPGRKNALATSEFVDHRWELLSSSAVSLAARIFGVGAQFVFTVMLGQFLGTKGMGIYMLALSVCTMTSVLGRAGMDLSILRFVAVHHSRGHQASLKHGWRTMTGYACLSSLVAATLLFILAPYIAEHVFSEPGLTVPLRWMLLSIVPFSLLNLVSESLRAVERIAEASFARAGLLPGFCILFFWLLFYIGLDIEGAVLAYVMSTVSVSILAYGLWRRAMPSWAQTPAQDGPTPREILSVSVSMAWISIASVIMSLADTVILGLFRPASEVGIYSAAVRVSTLFSFILIAVNSMLAPKFATLHQRGERIAMEQLGQFGTKLMLILALPLVLAFILAPATVLQMFGEQFRSGAVVLVLLTVGQLVNVSAGSVGLLLLMTGHERRLQGINTVSVLSNISLCLILVPAFGMVGAAIASASGLVILNVLSLGVSIRHVKVSTIPGISIAGKLRT